MITSARFLFVVAIVACGTAKLPAANEEVQKAVDAYVSAFNAQDIKTIASSWTNNCTYTDRESGDCTEGRAAVEKDIAASLKEKPNLRLAVRVDRIRLIKPDVASVDGQSTVGVAGEDANVSMFSAILVHQDGKWLIDSIEEMPVSQPASSTEALRELEWMVGHWVDKSDTINVDTTVRWTASRAFLLRSFLIQNEDGATQQGTQVIGWDPRSKQIRSWTFNSDGSFGDGTWTKDGDRWLINSSQTQADGDAASGTYVLTRVNNNTLTWQLIGHEVEGEPQPTGKPVEVVRVLDDAKPAAPAAAPRS